MMPCIRVVPIVALDYLHRMNDADDSRTRHDERLHRC
jgi:hypothetical protein